MGVFFFSVCIYRLQSYAAMGYKEINMPDCLSISLIQDPGTQGPMAF